MTKGKLCEDLYDKYWNEFDESEYQDMIDKLLDEAKREFPKVDKYEYYPGVELEEYNTNEVKAWFKKWFGDE
jgi:hypothetical protein